MIMIIHTWIGSGRFSDRVLAPDALPASASRAAPIGQLFSPLMEWILFDSQVGGIRAGRASFSSGELGGGKWGFSVVDI